MKTLSRIQFGNPILRRKAKKVSAQFLKTAACKKLIAQMFYAIKQAGGVGLAAPQVGISLQLTVIKISPTKFRPNLVSLPKTIIINPKIISYSKKQTDDWEGCLSFPDVRGKVPRSHAITIRYLNEEGKKVVRKVSGFLARVVQHEIDHLNGVVYVDRMVDMKTLMTLSEFKRRVLK